jgi:type IV secretion system protein VirD4
MNSRGWGPLTKKAVVLLLLWAAFVAWNGFYLIASIQNYSGNGPAWLANLALPSMFLNFWGLAAALFLVCNAFNLFGLKYRGRQVTLGCFAFLIMVGRLAGYNNILIVFLPWSPAVQFILLPVAMTLAGSILFVTFIVALSILFTVLTAVPVMMFLQMHAIDYALSVFRYQENGLAGFVGRGLRWLFNLPLPEFADDSKGARLATSAEIQQARSPRPEAMAFGHVGDPLFLKTDKHVLIMASTRSGKGVSLIIPHLLRYRGSAFVLDPKGENAKATGRHRAGINGKVHFLDPFGISGKPKSRFNPLSRFTPQNMEAESKALAAAMFVRGANQQEDDHWRAAGQQLLALIFLFVYLSPDIPAAEKDVPQARKILLGNLKPALHSMVKMDDADGLLSDLATSFLETPERELGSIVSTAQRQTEILDNPYIVACLKATKPRRSRDALYAQLVAAMAAKKRGEEGSDLAIEELNKKIQDHQNQPPEVDFSEWHRGTMTVYLCLSAPKFPTFNRWLRLVLTSALDEMTDHLDPPPLPVCFMLDELATLGHLATVENAVGLAAGYGVQLVTVFQDVAQMRDLYKGRWASFIGNAGVRAVFNLDDFDTAKYWSDFIGGMQVETRGRQEDIYGYNKGQNVGETMRPLISPDQLMLSFASGKMLVLAQGRHPIISDRVAYWVDTKLDGLWDDPREAATPQPGPQRGAAAPPPWAPWDTPEPPGPVTPESGPPGAAPPPPFTPGPRPVTPEPTGPGRPESAREQYLRRRRQTRSPLASDPKFEPEPRDTTPTPSSSEGFPVTDPAISDPPRFSVRGRRRFSGNRSDEGESLQPPERGPENDDDRER